MSAYLKRLDITNIEEGTSSGMYVKYVDIVEVVDQDGNPWEPVPGPDPWDELVVSVASKYSNLNDYSPGVEVFGHPAGYTGGSDQTIYQYRWQYQTEINPGSWVSGGGWTAYDNNPAMEVSYTIPVEATGGKIRLQSRARDENDDPVTQVMSNAPAKDVQGTLVMTPLVQKLNGDVVQSNEALEVPAGTHNLEVIASVIPPDIDYQWSLRSGTGTLTVDPNDPSKATYTIGNGDVAPLIATTLDSDLSTNASVSWQLFAI